MMFFQENMTMEDLKSMGVKLMPSPFDKKLHFDFTVHGDQIDALQDKKILRRTINYHLNIRRELLQRLECAEVLSPYSVIMEEMEAKNLTVRVYGDTDSACTTLNWQIPDFEGDVRKFWERVTRQVHRANTPAEVSENAEKLLSCIHVREVSNTAAGICLLLEGLMQVQELCTAVQVRECVLQENDRMQVWFEGKYMAFVLRDGTRLTFVLRNPGTGMKGEEEELYLGVFSAGKYYTEKVKGNTA